MVALQKQSFALAAKALIFDWRGTLLTTHPYKHCWYIAPETRQCLYALRKKGFWVGICSNLPQSLLTQEVHEAGIKELFDAIIGSKKNLPLKPDPTLLLTCVSKSPFAPNKSLWFIGDTAVDMLCAARAGLYAVHITSTFCQRNYADLELRTIAQLHKHLLPPTAN